MYRQGCRYKAAGCPEYQNIKLKSITQKNYLYMMILISIVFFLVKYMNAHTGIVFLRFPKKFYRLLWSALPFITAIETRGQKIPCFLSCLHVGGELNCTHVADYQQY